MNAVQLIGNITRDPDQRFTPKGTAVCEFGIAINERYKDDGGNLVDKPVFIDITALGQTAEVIAKWFGKGDMIGIEGKLSFESWVDKQTGQNRSKLKVTCERFTFCGKTAKAAAGGGERQPSPARGPQPARQQEQAAEDDDDQEIPF